MDDVEKFISALRDAHQDMEVLFLEGQCYALFRILRQVWPSAECWYDTSEGHVYTKIGRCYYDIRGRHTRVGSSCKLLDYKSGVPPHRWGARDKRRLC